MVQSSGEIVCPRPPVYAATAVWNGELFHELVDGSSLHVTSAHWFTPNHHAMEGVGLTPDLIIESGSDSLPQAVEAVMGE